MIAQIGNYQNDCIKKNINENSNKNEFIKILNEIKSFHTKWSDY